MSILFPRGFTSNPIPDSSFLHSARHCFCCSIRLKKISIAVLLFAVICGYSAAQSGPVPAKLFGQTFISISSYTNNAANIPIGNLGKQVGGYWGYIEPYAPGSSGASSCSGGTASGSHCYYWTVLDNYAAAAKAHGLSFQWTMDNAPPWAVTNSSGCYSGGNPGPGPSSITQCPGIIADTASFGAFMDALVTRYNVGSSIGTINSYELGNETDYTGTPSQFAAQWEEMVSHIKAINPSALIVAYGQMDPDTSYAPNPCGATNQGGQDNCFDSIWAAWKAINPNAHIDALSIHGYPHSATGNGSLDLPEVLVGGPGTVPGEPCTSAGTPGYLPCVKAAISRDSVTTYQGGTPQIWDTEGSWGTAGGSLNYGGQGATASQVAFLGRFMLLAWSGGMSAQEWYSWDNGSWGCIGCQSADATAYSQVRSWMVGANMTGGCALNPGSTVVWTCPMTLASGKQALAVWNTSGASSFSISAGQWTDFRDLSGGTSSIGSGTTSVAIGVQPILLETAGSTSAPAPPTGLNAIVQ